MGKTSLFNALTGLNQRVGNFPGVTVDRKSGRFTIDGNGNQHVTIELTDLPGTFSLFANSPDEAVATQVMLDDLHPDYPDLALVIADASQLRRSLLVCSQVIDLGIPTVLALNMQDVAIRKGVNVDAEVLSAGLGIPVVAINARTGQGLKRLKEVIAWTDRAPLRPFLQQNQSDFRFMLNTSQQAFSSGKGSAVATSTLSQQELLEFRTRQSLDRYEAIDRIIEKVQRQHDARQPSLTEKLDRILTHRVFGYVIFLGLLLLIFQSIFSWASLPMGWIESGFTLLIDTLRGILPPNFVTSLLLDGLLPGLSGILIFIPQIALLFAFITILEDSGYMARVSFIMDRLMRSLGLGGRSVIPLIGGMACAIPAILSTRTIGSWKERIITILVIPFTTCSARLPVYTLLISLVIPSNRHLGPFNMQGLVFMGMYVLGFASALLVALILKFLIPAGTRGDSITELPEYRPPRWKNVWLTMWEKVRIFSWDAGRVILGVSLVLWILSSSGPGHMPWDKDPDGGLKLEASWAGQIGKSIEPAIRPLGFDWKIGISLVTSFAAREVFVGTMATLYSVDQQDDEAVSLRERMRAEINPQTGKPRYDLAVGLSLMAFYAFSLQCMSTLAVVYRETKNFKWPLLQFIFMGILAYFASLLTFHLFQ